ncbi:MAG: hypothetical protein Q9182_005174 [Xanthomendoza sp. 2 TL-2023]
MASSEDTATIVSGIVTGLATLCVALRFFVRIRIKVGVGGFIIWGLSVDPDAEKLIQEVIDNGTTTTFDTRPHTTYLTLSFLSSMLYFSVVSAIKVSILLLYRRIFAIDRSFRIQSTLVGLIVFFFWLAVTIACLLNCRPLKYSWIGLSGVEHCINYNIFWMVTGAVEIVIDTVILALPIRMVLMLQLSPKRKFSVSLVFLLGGFIIITGIIRVIYGYAPSTSRIPSYTGADLWSSIHIGMAIVCACLPTLRPLVTRSGIISTAYSSIWQRYYSSRAKHSASEEDTLPSLAKDRSFSTAENFEMVPISATKDVQAEEVSLGGDKTAIARSNV